MSVYHLESAGEALKRSAVTIGMFDGVHLGHRSLLRALHEEAERIEGQSVVLTFDRHPATELRPERAPRLICSLTRRIAALEAGGVQAVVVARFDQAMSRLSPREFFEQILLERLRTAVVVVGPDFRFGRNRSGNFPRLAELGVEHGVAAVAIPPALVDEAPVSSTRIRTLLLHGRVEDAARLLGRPFVLEGVVVRGEGLGKKLGFPTANLRIDDELIVPGQGVYAADVIALGRVLRGVMSVGSRPTLGGAADVVEAHILDFDQSIYGEQVTVGFRARLRDQRKFASLDQLAAQIRRDVEAASEILSRSPAVLDPTN